MRTEPARQLEPFAAVPRELLVEVYGPLFGAIGRLSLSAPVRLSDFVNEREGFLRLTDVEFLPDGDLAPSQLNSGSTYLINKTGIELICQPSDATVERRADGQAVTWRGMSACELRDGRIVWWREYYEDPEATAVL